MGLLGSQASTERRIGLMNYELLLRAVFSMFHVQKFLKNWKIGKYVFVLEIGAFRASCFGYYSKECLTATPAQTHKSISFI